MHDDDIKIESYRINNKNAYGISVLISDIASLATQKQARQYLHELIARIIKIAVMEQYSNIQKIVDEEIFKGTTRELIELEVKKILNIELEKHIKEMFGE